MGTRDHLRAAVQTLSGHVPRSTVYGHLGWREIAGKWFYLHATGAVGAVGTVPGEIMVAPPDALAGFILPDPPAAVELPAAVRASLAVLDLAPDRVTAPVLGAVYRSVLGDSDFSAHLAGATGVGKTEVAALAQQHYGVGLDARHLPGSWSSTANSLEALAFAAKDALLVVDDFAPGGGVNSVARMHQEADRLFRGQGNRSGRGRLRPDGTLRPAKPPRGLVLSTGEDVPRGQSCRSRIWVVEVGAGDVDWEKLTACQADARMGLYAAALAGYLRWLAPHYGGIRRDLPAKVAKLRDDLRTEGQHAHARTPTIAADLLLGWVVWLHFAVEVGAITDAQRADLYDRVRTALLENANGQQEHVRDAEPAKHFVRLIAACLASGRAHLAARNGTAPQQTGRWGWRQEYVGSVETWRAQGERIGWVDVVDAKDGHQHVYLEPDAAYAAAQEFAREQGESLSVTSQTLWKRLREQGLLASVDAQRGRNTVRHSLDGVRREVLHLHSGSLLDTENRPNRPSGPEMSKG
jgi:hypothetical protein